MLEFVCLWLKIFSFVIKEISPFFPLLTKEDHKIKSEHLLLASIRFQNPDLTIRYVPRQSFLLKNPSKSRRLSSCGWKVMEIKLLTLRRCFVCVCFSLPLSRFLRIVSFAPLDFGSHGYRAYLHHDQARWRAERPGTPVLPFLFLSFFSPFLSFLPPFCWKVLVIP